VHGDGLTRVFRLCCKKEIKTKNVSIKYQSMFVTCRQGWRIPALRGELRERTIVKVDDVTHVRAASIHHPVVSVERQFEPKKVQKPRLWCTFCTRKDRETLSINNVMSFARCKMNTRATYTHLRAILARPPSELHQLWAVALSLRRQRSGVRVQGWSSVCVCANNTA
jgi:hypothetical protein